MLFRILKLPLLGLLLALVSAPTAAKDRWDLPSAFPSAVEHGLQLMRNTELQAALLALESVQANSASAKLRIMHGKADTQQQLAAQLRDWLLLLGLNEQELLLTPARKLKTHLRLEIETP